MFEQPTNARERSRDRNFPHGTVYVVDERQARTSKPQRAKERYAVPDLDDSVVVLSVVTEAAHDCLRKHLITAASAFHEISVAPNAGRSSRDSRGSCIHDETDGGPSTQDFVRVQLTATRLRIFEIR